LLQESRLQPVDGRSPAEAGTPTSGPYGGECHPVPSISGFFQCPLHNDGSFHAAAGEV